LGLLVLSIGGLAVLAACGPKAADLSILPAAQSTYQDSTANNKVDVLWVIDNSGSMYTKQQKLAAGFSSFMNVFTTKDFDFHMAVVTSDTRATGSGGQAGEFQTLPYPYEDLVRPARSMPSGYTGASGPSVLILDNNTTDLAEHFMANARVGDDGDSDAKILDAIQLSLGTPLLAGANNNFIRSDAHLAVIVVSDDDDVASSTVPADVSSFLQTLKPDRFDVLTRTYKKNFTVSAVVVDDPADTNCVAPFAEGILFKELAGLTSGSIANICDADFSTGLTNISKKIAEAITEIPLARTPSVSTIRISFNGTLVGQDGTNGWSYESTGNKIVFHGTAIPTANTSIAINYTPADIIR
jgi:hypothetical protein